MRDSVSLKTFLWVLVAVATADARVPGAERVEAQLRTSANEPVSLSRWRGQPTVLFYEDRGSTEQNAALKRELLARGRARGLVGRAHVLGVANLHGFDFFPANLLALSAVRDAERREQVPVLVDWNLTLSAPPWNLPPAASSVVLLDADGSLVRSWSGPLGRRDIEEFFAALFSLLGTDIDPVD